MTIKNIRASKGLSENIPDVSMFIDKIWEQSKIKNIMIIK